MNKSELVNWLQAEEQRWQDLLGQINPAQMEQAGAAGFWSIKDIIAHLTGWNHWVVARLRAAQRGEPEPSPPWPAHLQTDDEINAWIYDTNREHSVRQVLDESHQVFQQILTLVERLPDQVPVETIRGSSGRDYYFVLLGEQRFQPGESFDHFRDDHETDMRAWLVRNQNLKTNHEEQNK
jgi:hypothetical protein